MKSQEQNVFLSLLAHNVNAFYPVRDVLCLQPGL